MAKLKLDPQNSTNAIYQKSSDPRAGILSIMLWNKIIRMERSIHHNPYPYRDGCIP